MRANIVRFKGSVSAAERERRLGQKGAVLWFTGLSGSGKSTIAYALERLLIRRGVNAAVLDGDNVRFGLNKDAARLRQKSGYGPAAAHRFGLGFGPEDRRENIRRIGEVAKLFAANNVIALSAFVSPYRADRAAVREMLPPGRFLEIYCGAPLAVCEARDPKGLYKKARAGSVENFTGVSAPYEPPRNPALLLKTGSESAAQSIRRVFALLKKKRIIL